MRLALAGLGFEIEPHASLDEQERAEFRALDDTVAPPGGRTFRLSLVDSPPWEVSPTEPVPASGSPARVYRTDGAVRVSHEGFLAELNAGARRGCLYRRQAGAGGVRACLRVALRACLPLEGGLPLHGAGVTIGGRGVVFVGPSGAGKSTLASLCPWPVLSDEMVAVSGDPFQLWGTDSQVPAPLVAIFDLAKGPRTLLEPLAAPVALRRLLGVVLVPPVTETWSLALGVVGRLTASVPAFRLIWSPCRPPWSAIERTIDGLTADGSGRVTP